MPAASDSSRKKGPTQERLARATAKWTSALKTGELELVAHAASRLCRAIGTPRAAKCFFAKQALLTSGGYLIPLNLACETLPSSSQEPTASTPLALVLSLAERPRMLRVLSVMRPRVGAPLRTVPMALGGAWDTQRAATDQPLLAAVAGCVGASAKAPSAASVAARVESALALREREREAQRALRALTSRPAEAALAETLHLAEGARRRARRALAAHDAPSALLSATQRRDVVRRVRTALSATPGALAVHVALAGCEQFTAAQLQSIPALVLVFPTWLALASKVSTAQSALRVLDFVRSRHVVGRQCTSESYTPLSLEYEQRMLRCAIVERAVAAHRWCESILAPMQNIPAWKWARFALAGAWIVRTDASRRKRALRERRARMAEPDDFIERRGDTAQSLCKRARAYARKLRLLPDGVHAVERLALCVERGACGATGEAASPRAYACG